MRDGVDYFRANERKLEDAIKCLSALREPEDDIVIPLGTNITNWRWAFATYDKAISECNQPELLVIVKALAKKLALVQDRLSTLQADADSQQRKQMLSLLG